MSAFLFVSAKEVHGLAKGKYREWVEPDGQLRLQAWTRDGLTDEQIADKIGIHVSTLYEWKKKHAEIDEALKKGKEIADIEVENALHKRAIGYTTIETKKVISPQGTTITETIKEIPPDTAAAIYWLKNRKPDAWRDKQRNIEPEYLEDLSEAESEVFGDD